MVVRVRQRPREETLEGFAALPEEVRGRPKLIMGHTVFGLHEFIPNPSVYISMVRKPRDLVVSQFRYVVRTSGHRHHQIVASERLSIEDYVRSGISLEMDNSQTRAIAGDRDTPFGACTNTMLESAKRNIEGSFAVVGLTERFDETLILLKKSFGWSRLKYVRSNVSQTRDPLNLTDEAIALIDEHNILDNELYRFATERFEKAIARHPTFAEELAAFKRANSVYRRWGSITQTLPHLLGSKVGLRRLRSGTRAPSL
jgi:hypothetical protein